MWVPSDLYRLSHILYLDQLAPSWGPNSERDDSQRIGTHACMLNSRNGHSKAYLLYSMLLMDKDDGARMGPSSRQPWCSAGPGGGAKDLGPRHFHCRLCVCHSCASRGVSQCTHRPDRPQQTSSPLTIRILHRTRTILTTPGTLHAPGIAARSMQ